MLARGRLSLLNRDTRYLRFDAADGPDCGLGLLARQLCVVARHAGQDTRARIPATGSALVEDNAILGDLGEALRRIFLLEDQPAWPAHLRSRAVLRKSPKRHFVDPSLAAAALGATPDRLLQDTKTLGFLFESLVTRDLRIYSAPQHASVYHYRDSDNLEVDAVVSRDDGKWIAAEVKLSHHPASIDARVVS